jgi:hypothetical protein
MGRAGKRMGRAGNAFSDVVSFYKRLSPPARRSMWALLALEVVLLIVAERDIHLRPADEIRGPKLLWRIAATQNFIGPAAYFAFGRKGAS